MEDLDKLMNRYPQYKDLMRDTRKEIKTINQEIAGIQPGWSPPKLDLKPPSSGTWAPSHDQSKKIAALQGKIADIRKGVDVQIDTDFAGKGQEEIERVKADLSKIASYDKPLGVDFKGIEESQSYTDKVLQNEKQMNLNPSVTDILMGPSPSSKSQDIASKEKEGKDISTNTEPAQQSITDQLMNQSNASMEARLERAREFRENSKSIRDKEPD